MDSNEIESLDLEKSERAIVFYFLTTNGTVLDPLLTTQVQYAASMQKQALL